MTRGQANQDQQRSRRSNGEGSAPTLRPDGRWNMSVRYTDANGVGQRRTLYGKSRKECFDAGVVFRRSIEDGAPAVASKRLTLAVMAETWIESSLPASRRADATQQLYTRLARRNIIGRPIGALPLANLRGHHLERWLVDLDDDYADSTVRNCYAVMRAILAVAVRDKIISTNALLAIPRPAINDQEESAFLTPEQARALLDVARHGVEAVCRPGHRSYTRRIGQTRLAPLFEFLMMTGLRRGEALALWWGDVDLEAATPTLRVRRSLGHDKAGALVRGDVKSDKSRRTIGLSAPVVRILRALRQAQRIDRLAAGSAWQDSEYVFSGQLGGPIDPRNALRAFKVCAAAVGTLPDGVTLHSLRHTAATTMLSAGVPIATVSRIMGHSSVAITGDIYGHVAPDVADAAMATLAEALGG